MNTAETHPYHLGPVPDPALEGSAAATRRSADQPVGAGVDPMGWMLDCVIDGLLHCACAHHAVHPDLIDCIEQRAHGRKMAQESRS